MNEAPDGVFILVFVVGFALIAWGGRKLENWIRKRQGKPPVS